MYGYSNADTYKAIKCAADQQMVAVVHIDKGKGASDKQIQDKIRRIVGMHASTRGIDIRQVSWKEVYAAFM